MTEHRDPLTERFAALANLTDDSDWLEVRRRARSGSRRWLLLPIAAALAVVVVGSAFAVYRELVDFGSAEPAPERIQLDFDRIREHSAEASAKFNSPKVTPDGPAREVMRVQIDGETSPLWVVPTREGSFCYRLQFAAGCPGPEKTQDLNIGFMSLGTADGNGSEWVAGPVLDDAVQTVELVYLDGQTVRLPFVWVSEPINAGFYAYDVPARHEVPGHTTAAVIGRDEDGNAVAHTCLNRSDTTRLPELSRLCEPRD